MIHAHSPVNISSSPSDTYHVVPEANTHHCVGLLAEMEAVSTEVREIRFTILLKKKKKTLW